jgi:hypothetical protein
MAVESSVPGGRPVIAAGSVEAGAEGEADGAGEASGVEVPDGSAGVQAARRKAQKIRIHFFIGSGNGIRGGFYQPVAKVLKTNRKLEWGQLSPRLEDKFPILCIPRMLEYRYSVPIGR